MYKNKKNRATIMLMAAGLFMTAAFSGCTTEAPEEEKRVIVEQDAPDVDYKLAAVTRGDVISSAGLRCTYTQYNGENLSFEVSGKLVSKVYVKDGDTVKKGMLLAELSGGSREAEIEQLEYQIQRNTLLLEQVDDNENMEIQRRWLNKLFNRGFDQTGDIEELQKNNNYSRQDLNDSISLDQKQLDQIKTSVRQSKLYAPIDGTVSIVKKNLEGSTSVRDEVVMQVKDNTECFFSSKIMTYKDVIQDGQQLEMKVVSGPSKGTYLVEPYLKSYWTDQMFFSIVEGGEGAIFDAGDTGTVTVILGERLDVLTLPVEAVHGADEKWYVYVLNDEGSRDVKWIEVGLSGDGVIEIVSGLEEGEKVILK